MFTTRRRFTSFPALSRRGERALLEAEVCERLTVAADLAAGHPERAAVLGAEADAITAVMGDV
ncbi:hypothetical protein A5698_05495 [Mycobacterium sp. E136]|uniref:hypothetical protein n=1 Tax=Mycobacterium sp. E136 TaxID=1834125 RepID=UPI0007FC6E77|nr:hypothetical protein [Mycobacterium sp. E136]OBG84355.1 hypothetical protein A5698_05495 [Mycobacterium sp. E136]